MTDCKGGAMMLTIFNRRELAVLRTMAAQSGMAKLLAAEGIEYEIRPDSPALRLAGRSGAALPGSAPSETMYYVYVKKADFERASALLRGVRTR